MPLNTRDAQLLEAPQRLGQCTPVGSNQGASFFLGAQHSEDNSTLHHQTPSERNNQEPVPDSIRRNHNGTLKSPPQDLTPTTPTTQNPSEDEAAVSQQSTSALRSARRNFSYLLNPGTSTDRPNRLRTRALLRTFRYIAQFIIWRLVRWAKYAAVGFAVATVAATGFGTVVSGARFVLAPTGIAGSIVAASVWGVGKFVARKANARWKREGGDGGVEGRERVYNGMREERMLQEGYEGGGAAVPW
ncbi:hypothetical protein CLAFUW4_08766 [Fulvia fulva]|uniref:Uncharacterized protein n=1 Tax=Passalora fulva TaxID=5499 RepID=A0A9Q8PG65_PASFU|nr:uncharacterized protein CLAFUR5_08866 [Fulvia fulva]KAK4614232.1 hypothetical protein CLAFUR4_08771 [Fulvia fulva]KAK4614665.1 hypothetical protein CLAFUR0_08766 [Fulvia fulva]UJO21829.1 hypothetical protein CLAFUR5_08866 [Fulvia fulva]WPV19958.1 hypothetical protein CLAFUW4_08766 [Fulvia fulva]WPV34971.1 hypothetical protein CLAFUW7_08766 [Fulvia fulva]